MSGVTQQNAAISEESASASTQIHSEIVNIRGFIQQVAELVDGGKAGRREDSAIPFPAL